MYCIKSILSILISFQSDDFLFCSFQRHWDHWRVSFLLLLQHDLSVLDLWFQVAAVKIVILFQKLKCEESSKTHE
jgi:hypothetical protein